jgi:uncharacterized caspase-like protein
MILSRLPILRIRYVLSLLQFVFLVVAFAVGQTSADALSDRYMQASGIPRLALVMGAEHYHSDRGVDPVPNALNDAKQIHDVLQADGFSFIRVVPDPDNVKEIQDYITELLAQAGSSDQPVVLVFFFAGHGFQNAAYNYIVPTGARGDHAIDDSFPVFNIVNALASHRNSIAILLFDSCRTGIAQTDSSNPITAIDHVGFAPLPSVDNTDLGLAASFGFPAKSAVRDGDTDSPYTTALREYMSRESMSLAEFFDQVQLSVKNATLDATGTPTQIPFEVKGAFDTGFFLQPAPSQQDAERLVWQLVLKNNQPQCVKDFISTHPGGYFVRSAMAWLAEPSHPGPSGEVKCPVD